MNVSENGRRLLLEFQRVRFALTAFPEVEDVRTAYYQAQENLKQIKEPAIGALVSRMTQEWTKDVTHDGKGHVIAVSTNKERALDIISAENELYELTFTFGDNTPSASSLIQ